MVNINSFCVVPQYLRDDFESESESGEDSPLCSDNDELEYNHRNTTNKNRSSFMINESNNFNRFENRSGKIMNVEFDFGQPIVSNSTQINDESIRSNRLSTLFNAVSPTQEKVCYKIKRVKLFL